MCSSKIEVELCAIEASAPLLKAVMSEGEFMLEFERYRLELLEAAGDDNERREIEERIARAVNPC